MNGREALKLLARLARPGLQAAGWREFAQPFAFEKACGEHHLVLFGIASKWSSVDAGGLELNFDLARLPAPGRPEGGSHRLSNVIGPGLLRDRWVSLRDEKLDVALRAGPVPGKRRIGLDRPENFYFDVWAWVNGPSDLAEWAPLVVAAAVEAEGRLRAR